MRVYILLDYHSWVSSLLLDVSIYCLGGEVCDRLSTFSGFNDVRDVTKLSIAPYPLVCPVILLGHTNH